MPCHHAFGLVLYFAVRSVPIPVGHFQGVQGQGHVFFVVDNQANHVLVGPLYLQALHVQNQVHGSRVKSLRHRLKRNVGFHAGNNGVSTHVLDRKHQLVHSGLGPLVTAGSR